MKTSKHGSSRVAPIFTMAAVVVSIICLLWIGANVRPDAGTVNTVTAAETLSAANVMSRFDSFVNNTKSDALGNVTYIKKEYSIPEEAVVAPPPEPTGFCSTTDPNEVLKVIEDSAALLDGQTVYWNPDLNFFPDAPFEYYMDETILVICWKEVINGGVYSFAEVKIADGSQLRRAIAENSYGSSVQLYPTDMAKAANAIVAINGDFYSYRSLGITVYQRTLYRFQPKLVDSCFFTSEGKMLFSYRGEMESEAQAQQFIEDNDVVFALAFGPVLVDNYERVPVTSYPVGEVDAMYSRAAIAEFDDLHYLLVVLGQQGSYSRRAQLSEFGQTLYDMGVRNAYTLDGGQTATLVFNGKCFNRVDWDSERTMSDIVYFGTALTNGEG